MLTWLAWTPLSLSKLVLVPARLFPSSSVRLVSVMLGGLATAAADAAPAPAFAPFIFWISKVMASVFIASTMFFVAVGKRASTVYVQSSWFCSNRRRRLSCE
jgi:hypothetical protein